jgi:hypothetical protein
MQGKRSPRSRTSDGRAYAIENAFDVVNMSLSTTKREFAEGLHEPPT